MFTSIVTTAERYTDMHYYDGTSIIKSETQKSGLKEYQRVIAVGSMVKNVKEGDLVCINPERYAVRKYAKDNSIKDDMEETYRKQTVEYSFHVVRLNDEQCLILQENDIDYIVEEYTEE